MKIENVLSGKKTYFGLIILALGEAFVAVEGLPEELGQTMKFIGFLCAVIGRYFVKGV